jgi:hypothetical protein
VGQLQACRYVAELLSFGYRRRDIFDLGGRMLCAGRMVVALCDEASGHTTRTATTAEGGRRVLQRDGLGWGSNAGASCVEGTPVTLIANPDKLHLA